MVAVNQTVYLNQNRHYYQMKGRNVTTGATSVTGSGPGALYVSHSKVRNWERTPNYKTIVRAKPAVRLPDQPYSMVDSHVLEDGLVTWDTFDSPWWYISKSNLVGICGGLGSHTLIASENAARSRLVSRAKGAQFNAPVFLAEAGKTVEMIHTMSTRCFHILAALKKGDLSKFFTLLRFTKENRPSRSRVKKASHRFNQQFHTDSRKAAGNILLEFTYGWSPFLNDIVNACTAMYDAMQSEVGVVGRVVGKDTNTRKFMGPVIGPSNGWITRFWHEQRDEVRIVWQFKPTTADLIGRFGLLNPLIAGWELFPFSFVADWALPIGDLLEDLDTNLRFTHVGGTTGIRRYEKKTLSSLAYVYTNRGVAFEDYKYERTEVTRTPLTGVPTLALNDLKITNPIPNVRRAMVSLSLLQQNLKWLR